MENILLSGSNLPYGAIQFNKINLSDYKEAITEGIRLHNIEIRNITDNPDIPDFQNTIAALDRSGEVLSRAISTLSNLESAVGSPELMDILAELTPVISKHYTDIQLNRELWCRIRAVHDSGEIRLNLNKEQLRLVDETYRSFSESGANLEGNEREEFKQLKSRLSDLNVKFSQNVTNGMSDPERRLWLTEGQLSGLPESIRLQARENARNVLMSEGKDDDGSKYLFTVFAPSYIPFMKYADKRNLREKLYRLYNSRNNGGKYDNTEIVRETAELRLRLANLMGYPSFADWHLNGTMASSQKRVMDLLEDLREKYTEPMKREIKRIEEFARTTEGPVFKLHPWDYSYWANKLKDYRFSFREEDLKPYFELENTISGVFGLATKLYGYSFRKTGIPVYHPDVKAFEVFDKDDTILGILYADFHNREGKSPGAWMTEFRTESKGDSGKRSIPLVSIVMNFPKPIEGKPVLLTPSEVNTFLHEFGHALHGLSAQATYESLSGTNVYHDFVELFSQFNENFLTEREWLDSFARHYETGEKLPEDLLDNFIKSHQFGAAYACIRQLGFGYLDMAWHTIKNPLPENLSVRDFENKAIQPVEIFPNEEGCLVSPSFGHIFSGGYAAGYYGYKWAEVLDADAFAAFKEEGVFNSSTASRFKIMLEAGGTADPMELYRQFRGKEPSTEALLVRDGIA